MFNLLLDPVIGVLDVEGQIGHISLPQLYFALGVDGIAMFPALRPHQRHAWHAMLCQLGALACLKSGLSSRRRTRMAGARHCGRSPPSFPAMSPGCW